MDGLTMGYANGDDLLAVTSTNKSLRRLRKAIRRVDHDRLCSEDVVTSKQTDEQFLNGEQFTIVSAESSTRTLPEVHGCVSRDGDLTISGYTLSFEGTNKTAFVLEREKDADKLSNRIRNLFHKGKLSYDEARRILDWIDEINRFELSALATVHKSQGRSVNTIYIDTRTVLCKPDWISSLDHKRMLYTAITRPRHRVVFYELPTYCEQGVDNVPLAA
jgi:hypothetical protein